VNHPPLRSPSGDSPAASAIPLFESGAADTSICPGDGGTSDFWHGSAGTAPRCNRARLSRFEQCIIDLVSNIASGLKTPMLHEFIAANRDEIISRCRAKVALRSVPPPTAAEIDHGVPVFLDQLGDALRWK
jgi:hypothetical protein